MAYHCERAIRSPTTVSGDDQSNYCEILMNSVELL